MAPIPASRIAGAAETVFGRYSALASAHGVINLGQGFPDEDGPLAVREAAQKAIADGANQYAPGRGVPALRAAVAAHQSRHHGLVLDPDEQVVVTTGATEAIAATVLAFVEPGDEVVLIAPYYDSYEAMVRMAGGVLRTLTLRGPEFRLDPQELAATVTDRTKLLVLNTPHNPTGRVLDASELAAVAEAATRHDVLVLSDEVYEHLTFDGLVHVPIATLPGMFERTVTVSSLGKSFSLTGWKVGWATGPKPLVDAVLAAKQWLSYTSGTPFQHAAALALTEHGDFPRSLTAELETKRNRVVSQLLATGFRTRRPQGTYFAISDITGFGWEDGEEFCTALPRLAHVVAIPLQGFYSTGPDGENAGRNLVRWAFCKQREVLDEAMERLATVTLQRPRYWNYSPS